MAPLQPAARRPVTFLLVILIGVASSLAFRSQLNANEANDAKEQSEANVRAIQANTDRLEKVVHEQCEAGQVSAHGINTVLETLINAVTITTSIQPAEKADRIRKYTAALQPIPVCAQPKK
jgi:uncharacterized membrane protein